MESLKYFIGCLAGTIVIGFILSFPILAALSLITIPLGLWIGLIKSYIISFGIGIVLAIVRNIPSIKFEYKNKIDGAI